MRNLNYAYICRVSFISLAVVTIQPTIQRPFVKKWLRVSLLLWMFYEVMWMLFDSTADRPVILPSAIEYLTDFAVCATQTFFCFLLIRFEIHTGYSLQVAG